MGQTRRIADGSSSDHDFLMTGFDLSAGEARRCEKVLKRNPHDLATRLELIGYYKRTRLSISLRSKYYLPKLCKLS